MNIGAKHSLCFDLHAVEDAAVGIDADEELLGRFESRAKLVPDRS